MKVYISWSGQVSYKLAILLRDFIGTLLPGLETWVSAEDIDGGARWSQDLLRILDETAYSIVCADPSNHLSLWLQFELGALAKSTGKWNISVLLNKLKQSELRGPLTQFSPVTIERNNILRLIEDIHANCTQIQVSRQELILNLDKTWPEFYQNVNKISMVAPSISKTKPLDPKVVEDRDEPLEYVNEVGEKILALVSVNEGIDEDRIATTVYLRRGDTLKHLIDLEKMGLVWSTLSFGNRRWFITELGRKYLPGFYQE